ncbi:MAG: hypothetical protein PVG07_02600 [Acidobacteriota bacterium]|jgi:hypothetical protein
MVVRRLGVLSLGKVMGVLYALMGLIFGLIFSLVSLMGATFGAAFSDTGGADALFGVLFGIGAVIALPIFYGVMGFIFGLLTAALYNLTASIIGGLELDVE